MEYFDALNESFARLVDQPIEETRFLLTILFNVPFGFVFKNITNPQIRLIISFGMGIFIQYFVYRQDIIYPFFGVVVNYTLLRCLGKNSIAPTFIFSMALLWMIHVRSMINKWASWDIDVNVILMYNTAKFTSLPFNLKDGLYPEKTSKYQQAYAITKCPSFIEYAGYIYFYPTAILGPFFEFKDYYAYIYMKDRYAKIPSSIMPTLKLLGFTSIMVVVYLIFKPYTDFDYILTSEFADSSLWHKYVYTVFIVAYCFRFKYYIGFTLAEAACRSSGIGYYLDHKTGEEKWDNIKSIDLTLELTQLANDHAVKWNSSVGNWLKRYVYIRCLEHGWSNLACYMLTFFVSMIWHGFYPGYYFSFFFWAIAQYAAKYIRSCFSKIFGVNEKGDIKVSYFVKLLFLHPYHFTMIPSMLSFHYMTFEKSMILYTKSYPWYVHCMPAIMLVTFMTINMLLPKKKSNRNSNSIEQIKKNTQSRCILTK